MNTSKTFLFAGASSAIAKETALLLQEQGHQVIGISTKPSQYNYNEFYEVDSYTFGGFPILETAIDGLVYFPGTINLKPFARLTQAEFLKDLEINSLGAVAVSTGMPFHASISMAKGAIEGLTKALAAELAPSIRVNCVAPSLVNTPLGNKFISTPEKLEQMEKRNPLRKVGDPKDVANAIAFLVSENAAWVSGQILAVDGGMNTLKNG